MKELQRTIYSTNEFDIIECQNNLIIFFKKKGAASIMKKNENGMKFKGSDPNRWRVDKFVFDDVEYYYNHPKEK